MKRLDLRGQKFGKLIVLDAFQRNNHTYWKCECECGRKTEVRSDALQIAISCGCEGRRKLKLGSLVLRHKAGEASFRNLYRAYKYAAKHRNFEFALSLDEFRILTKQPCFYCGMLPQTLTKIYRRGYNGEYIYNGVDRKDNTLGYILGNVVTCCTICNLAKRDLSVEVFLAHAKKIIDYQSTKK